MKGRYFAFFLGAVISLLFLGTDALAKGGACKDDVAKLCPNVERGKGGIHRCLKQNQDLLSPACRANLEEKRARHQALKQACGADRQKFCGNIQPGDGRVRDCMKAHEAQLSQACRDAKQKFKHEKGKSTWSTLRSSSAA